MITPLSEALRAFADVEYQIDRPVQEDQARHVTAAELSRVLARIVEGQSVEQAFGAPGEWGYHTPIGDGVLAMLRAPKQDDGRPRWHYVEDELPDDDLRVLIAVNTGDDVEPDFGYHADGKWWFDGPPHLCPVEANVYAWAELTMLPARKDGAS